MEGVTATSVGYAGGATDNPTYREVCHGGTGHAEVARVAFDPSVVTYQQLLETFWSIHDPTQLNRQGPDVGAQYRSVIFYHSPEQQAAAEASIQAADASGRFSRPIVTQLAPAPTYYLAEDYHQQYVARSGGAACSVPQTPDR